MSKIYIFIIPFLTVCATLYQIVFWIKFGINGLEIIGVEDIIKTAIQPISFAIIILLQNTLTTNFIYKNRKTTEDIHLFFNPFIYFSVWVVVIGLFILSTIIFNYFLLARIYIVGFLIWVAIKIYISDLDIFKQKFKNKIKRNMFVDFIVATPLIFCLGGYYSSELIYKNFEYKYIISRQTIPNSIFTSTADTIKLIGFSEDFIVLTTIENDEIIFLNKSNISKIVFKLKKNDSLFN